MYCGSEQFRIMTSSCLKKSVCWGHRIINDRIENYGADIVFISKYSSIAAMKNVMVDGDLLPSPPPPLAHPPTTPIPYPFTYWGGL